MHFHHSPIPYNGNAEAASGETRCDGSPVIVASMSGPTGSGEHQRIEVQYTLEDEVLIIDHLDDPPEDFGEALARTLAGRRRGGRRATARGRPGRIVGFDPAGVASPEVAAVADQAVPGQAAGTDSTIGFTVVTRDSIVSRSYGAGSSTMNVLKPIRR